MHLSGWWKSPLGIWEVWENVGTSWLVVAQTGTTKTLIGWVLVLLCLGLALLVVGRPNAREPRKRRW